MTSDKKRAEHWLWEAHKAWKSMDNKRTEVALAHLAEWSIGGFEMPTRQEHKDDVERFIHHLKEEYR